MSRTFDVCASRKKRKETNEELEETNVASISRYDLLIFRA
jgi:hypothetical protein